MDPEAGPRVTSFPLPRRFIKKRHHLAGADLSYFFAHLADDGCTRFSAHLRRIFLRKVFDVQDRPLPRGFELVRDRRKRRYVIRHCKGRRADACKNA